MKICPIMSTAEKQAACLGEACAWWTVFWSPIDLKEVGECSIKKLSEK